MLNGDAHHSFEGELRFASDPLPYQRPAKEYHMNITDKGILVSNYSDLRMSVNDPRRERGHPCPP